MTAIVLCDARGHAFKIARDATNKSFLDDEADWLAVASKTPGVREHVAKFIRYWPYYIVIERECPMPTLGYRRRDEHAIFDLHYDVIGKRMNRVGWTAPEFKQDSYVITDRGPILVDASMAQRIGKVLLRYTVDLLRGRRTTSDRPSDYAYYVRREIGERTITERAAAPVLQALSILETQNGNRWP